MVDLPYKYIFYKDRLPRHLRERIKSKVPFSEVVKSLRFVFYNLELISSFNFRFVFLGSESRTETSSGKLRGKYQSTVFYQF